MWTGPHQFGPVFLRIRKWKDQLWLRSMALGVKKPDWTGLPNTILDVCCLLTRLAFNQNSRLRLLQDKPDIHTTLSSWLLNGDFPALCSEAKHEGKEVDLINSLRTFGTSIPSNRLWTKMVLDKIWPPLLEVVYGSLHAFVSNIFVSSYIVSFISYIVNDPLGPIVHYLPVGYFDSIAVRLDTDQNRNKHCKETMYRGHCQATSIIQQSQCFINV